jgi:putative membrane protein
MAAVDTVLGPPAVGSALAAVLYVRGSRRHLRLVAVPRRRGQRLRAWAFFAALATILVALDSPIDTLAPKYFWVHMVQHVLLMMVAAPLLVLAAPWMVMWRGLSLGVRRSVATALSGSPTWRAVGAGARWLASPVPAWVAFNVTLVGWHLPALYGLTLRDGLVHDVEHLSFLVLGVLFWAQAIDSPPLRARLGLPGRVAYVTLGAVVSWLLAVVLAFAPHPLYAAYVQAHAHGGLSALNDQQLAAGIMWGPGSIPYAVFVFVALYRWLVPAPAEEIPARAPRTATRRSPGFDSRPLESGR